jgi:hypothetical protein
LYFNENDSTTFVRNLSCLYCTQTTLHVSAIQPSSGVSYIYINAKTFHINGSVEVITTIFSIFIYMTHLQMAV